MGRIRSTARRGWVAAALAAALIVGFVAVIVSSPWLTRAVVRRSEDWHELSEIGQAYGGVSAILSGLAFCGIAGSLMLQWRHVRQAQIMTARERHFELVKLGLDDPDLIIGVAAASSPAEARQWVIRNLWVAHWAMLWDMRSVSQPVLRLLFDDLFSDATALDWWDAGGASAWERDQRGPFLQTANDAYRDARSAAERAGVPPTVEVESAETPRSPIVPQEG